MYPQALPQGSLVVSVFNEPDWATAWLQETLGPWKSADGYTQKIRKKNPEYTTEEFQDSSKDLYNTRSFIKKALDFSFVQTAMTEAQKHCRNHKVPSPHDIINLLWTLHGPLTLSLDQFSRKILIPLYFLNVKVIFYRKENEGKFSHVHTLVVLKNNWVLMF